jgi:arabinose-5-phosphate isomerase
MNNHKEIALTKKQILENAKEVLRIEGEAVLNLINYIDEEFVKAVEIIYKSKGRVVLTGLGKSGLIARKIVATLNSTGTPAIFLHPTDALHGDLGMVRSEDVAIVISKSGANEEILNLLPMFKRIGVTIIAMTALKSSKLAQQSDVILSIAVKEEACPYDLAPTASTTATLALGDAISVTLLHLRNFTEEDFAFLHPAGSLGKRLSLRIKEIMITGDKIPIVSENDLLTKVIYEISSKRLGTTCVVNNDGILTGIITDGDLRRLLEKTLDIKNLVASDVMTKNPKMIKSDVLASYALQMMENYKITSLIISDNGLTPIGIIHLHDLINLGLQSR